MMVQIIIICTIILTPSYSKNISPIGLNIMQNPLSRTLLCRLMESMERPAETVQAESNWPYPFPEAERIVRYGQRCLTPAEQQLFPGLRLVLNVCKVRLTEPPLVMPEARAGWAFGERLDRLDTSLSRAVVWTAETHPGHYLIRMPGGATLLAPLNQMAWTAVAEEGDDIPLTTLADVKADKWRQQWRTAVRQNIRSHLRI
jgi:hypothetical protein